MSDTLAFTSGSRLAEWTHGVQPSVLHQAGLAAQRSDSISFALGMPAPELFPAEAYTQALTRVLGVRQVTEYGLPSSALTAQIARMMQARGCPCGEERIFVTAGAQQGLSLIASLFLERGRQIMVEEYSYGGILQVAAPWQPDVLTVPIDAESGLDVEALEQQLQAGARPAFIYTIPLGHNPVGVSLSLEKRHRLVELARTYQVPIIEDDAYGFLSYTDEHLPPLHSLDDEWVFYVGSFSKILAPGLRVGWVVMPARFQHLLGAAKNAQDLQTSNITQYALASYLEHTSFDDYLTRLRTTYRERRDSMLASLRDHFPAGARWHPPTTGIFVWIELPAEYNITELARRAPLEEGVALIPGQAFIVTQPQVYQERHIRLNFSHPNSAKIREGIQRLGNLIQRM
ncbi:aminotransferase-like domain-containing protein [Dictyobacter aurantiacus]|uniref:Aminotransferase n=1 Tax=Dictyobacter aurantiacus TaxID=1936993 RepID=A0A401ZKM1_9CHLR|nr:PLP-dependent aminotransferase family protein [Dictyobacter aurantiacus]GCE07378.1 aminotransferase [Dictyobacter aurantiacus]